MKILLTISLLYIFWILAKNYGYRLGRTDQSDSEELRDALAIKASQVNSLIDENIQLKKELFIKSAEADITNVITGHAIRLVFKKSKAEY